MRAAALVLALSGCSFVFTTRPPPASPPPVYFPVCVNHYGHQWLDGAIAMLATTGAIYFATKDETLGVLTESGIALGFGISALATIGRPVGCKRAQDAFTKVQEDRYRHSRVRGL